MILSDKDIKKAIESKRILIDPFEPECVQPSSYDLHLQNKVLVFDNYAASVIDVRERQDVSRIVEIGKEGLILKQFCK